MRSHSLDQRVRLYGHFHGEHSLGTVGEGFSAAFPDAPRYDLDFWENTLDEVVHAPGGAEARYGVFLGRLDLVELARARGKHEQVLVMVAPNSGKISPALLERLEANATGYLVPSLWAAGVLRFYTEKPITVAPHGVLAAYRRPLHAQIRRSDFSVLHLSSTLGERKGTRELIEAWAKAKLPKATLFISAPAEGTLALMDAINDSGANNLANGSGIKLTRRLDKRPEDMRELYACMHYVCQPSRGEGFGLVPLEARACGTPVIATNCTGHGQHMFGPGIVHVPTGELEPIDDFPGALAPSLSADDLAQALVSAYEDRNWKIEEAESYSTVLHEEWSWKNKLKGLRDGFGSD